MKNKQPLQHIKSVNQAITNITKPTISKTSYENSKTLLTNIQPTHNPKNNHGNRCFLTSKKQKQTLIFNQNTNHQNPSPKLPLLQEKEHGNL